MIFASYNIQFGRGRDGRIDLNRMVAAVSQADVIALQEVDRGWQRSSGVDQAAEIAALLPQHHWVFGASASFDGGQPAGRGSGLVRREFGNMLLARTPIQVTRNLLLPAWGRLDGLSRHCAALEGLIATAAGPLRVVSTHLSHVAGAYRLEQVRALLDWQQRAAHVGPPITPLPGSDWDEPGTPAAMPTAAVLMGDFNCESNTPEYDLLAGPRSDWGGRALAPDGFVDAWVATGQPEGQGATADIHGRPVRIDYQFVHASLAPRLRSARIDSEADGSDHQPIFCELDLSPDLSSADASR